MSSITFGELFNGKFGLRRSSFVVCCQFIKILGRVELKASETWNIHQFDIETHLKVGQP